MLVFARILILLEFLLLGALLGAAIAFFGLIVLSTVSGADNMNGGLAMGAASFAPAGAVLGGMAGLFTGWRFGRKASSNTVMISGFGLLALTAIMAGGYFAYEELTDGNPYKPGEERIVAIEWRLPEAVHHDWVDGIFRYTMRSSYMNWTLSTWWDEPRARDEDGKTILRMKAEIRWRVKNRIFQLWRAPDHDNRITVDLGLPKDPDFTMEYGPWQAVDGYPGNSYRLRILRKE